MGRPRRAREVQRIQLRVDRELADALYDLADANGRSLNNQVVSLIRDAVVADRRGGRRLGLPDLVAAYEDVRPG